MTLFQADQTIVTGAELLTVFVTWERDNRTALAAFPELRKHADYIRASAKTWFKTAVALRAAYKADPTDASRTALPPSLSVIHQALTESTAYLAKYGPH